MDREEKIRKIRILAERRATEGERAAAREALRRMNASESVSARPASMNEIDEAIRLFETKVHTGVYFSDLEYINSNISFTTTSFADMNSSFQILIDSLKEDVENHLFEEGGDAS